MIPTLALMFRWFDEARIHRCLLASLRDALISCLYVRRVATRLPESGGVAALNHRLMAEKPSA